jgi:hypothetical protein
VYDSWSETKLYPYLLGKPLRLQPKKMGDILFTIIPPIVAPDLILFLILNCLIAKLLFEQLAVYFVH